MKNTFLLFVLLFTFWSCNEKSEYDEVVRPVFNIISTDLMPYVEGMEQTSSIYNSSEIEALAIEDDSVFAVKYTCFWVNDNGYLQIKIYIAETELEANKLLIQKSNTVMNLDGTALAIDDVAVAGEKSYGSGRLFKRDNIIVVISGILNVPIDVHMVDPSISKIAKLIDDKILHTEKFYSADELKPRIIDMSFSGSPEKLFFTLSVEPEEDLQAVIYWANGKKIQVGNSLTTGYVFVDSSNVCKNIAEDEMHVYAISKYGFCRFKKFSATTN